MIRIVAWMFLMGLVVAAAWSGVVLRDNVWDWTKQVRFNGDIDNGFNWGKIADTYGYLNVYDEMGSPSKDNLSVDYGPLRLGVMSAWVQWLKQRYPDLSHREAAKEYHAPLLWFNTGMEAAAALSAWLLVAHLVRRSRETLLVTRPTILPLGIFSGFIAALLIWFNPLILWDAHAWPQWDIWPMPFYLLAAYCACRRWWMIGGLLIGGGSLFKGQILMIAWTLPVWAICVGDWRGALRFVGGALCSIAIGGSVWELSIYTPGPHGFHAAVARGETIRRINWPAAIWTAAWVAFALFLPRRFSVRAVVYALGISLFSTLWLFGGSWHWIECGFLMGTWHFPNMYMGTTSNLPAMLHDIYKYQRIETVCFTINWPSVGLANCAVTLRTLMLAIYITLCLFTAIFAAVNDRRRDTRLAVAIALPWLLFYVLPVQIHERYLVYFSTCAALLVAVGFGYVLIGFSVTLVGLCIILHGSLGAAGIPRGHGRGYSLWSWEWVHTQVADTHPNIAWLLLLASAIFLYSIVPPRRNRSVVFSAAARPVFKGD